MERGTISHWHDEKGFGFIQPEGGGEPVFIHVKGVRKGRRRPAQGQKVSYSLGHDRDGRPRAQNVITPRPFPIRLALISALLTLLALVLALTNRPFLVLYCYLTTSLVSFGLYSIDKRAAKKGMMRLRENTLHLLALLGGWPGAWVAQKRFRHKYRQRAFKITFMLTVLFNLSVLAWTFTAQGTASMTALARLIHTAWGF